MVPPGWFGTNTLSGRRLGSIKLSHATAPADVHIQFLAIHEELAQQGLARIRTVVESLAAGIGQVTLAPKAKEFSLRRPGIGRQFAAPPLWRRRTVLASAALPAHAEVVVDLGTTRLA
jgi:hypothetical protein